MTTLEGFTSFDFEGPLAGGGEVRFRVYERGTGRRPIVLFQELPGIGPETLDLARRLDEAGYRVFLPHLFGPLGKTSFVGNTVRLLCMRRVFHLFATDAASPIVAWMRALCRDVRARCESRGVGTIGMCLTGNFAITLMADDAVVGGVASQPSLPVFHPKALHMSAEEIRAAREGMAAKGPALAMRYEQDRICPAAKMEAFAEAFGEHVIRETFPGKGHSLLTLDWCEAAFTKVLEYFEQRFAAD